MPATLIHSRAKTLLLTSCFDSDSFNAPQPGTHRSGSWTEAGRLRLGVATLVWLRYFPAAWISSRRRGVSGRLKVATTSPSHPRIGSYP